MRTLTFNVPEKYHQKKAMSFLRGHCLFSSLLIIRLKKTENGILRNGKLLRSIDILSEGDIVTVNIPDHELPAEPNTRLSVSIVYEDEDIIVFDKPPNMPVHPSRGHKNNTLANACAAYFSQKGIFDAFRPINRLDKDTSGLVVAAKNSYAASRLSGKIEKEYIAIAEGVIEKDSTIDSPIRLKPGFGITQEAGEGGKIAVTHVFVLQKYDSHTLVRLILETGRTHQIRVHLSSVGHPLAGDDMYGGNHDIISRQALHCERVSFIHPVSNRAISLKSPLPEDFSRLESGGEVKYNIKIQNQHVADPL